MMNNIQIREAMQELFSTTTLAAKALANDASGLALLVNTATTLATWLVEENDLADALDEVTEVNTYSQVNQDDESLADFIYSFTDSYGGVIAVGLSPDESDDNLGAPFYRLYTRDCDAGGYPADDGGFVVLAGSIASPDTTQRFATRHPGSFELRQDLIESGMLIELPDGELEVTVDLWFETPARAASVLSGQICGSDQWRLAD